MPVRSGEIAVTGNVAVTAKLNIRQSAPSRLSPVLRKQASGSQLNVVAITAGDEVQGNRLWFRLADGGYAWSGACGALVQGAASRVQLPAEAPPLAVPTAAAPFPPANIVDIYHYDTVRNFEEARTGGVLGVIHKATTGQSGRDDQYAARRRAATDAVLLWGAYHWGTGAPATAQVDNFLTAAEPDETTLVALDFEETPGNQMTLGRAREFLELIEEKLGRKAVIYSGSTIKNALGHSRDAYFGSHRLWLAQYGAKPDVQASWDNYWLWQFTEGKASDPRRRRVPGIPGNSAGELDCNYYPFTADQLESEWAS